MLQGLPPDSRRDLLLSVGSHRGTRPLSPEEVAKAFKVAIDAGSTLPDLAAAVHFDGTSMITRFVRLLGLPGDVLRVVNWGQAPETISFTAASEVSRLKNADEKLTLANSALEFSLTTSEIKSIVQMRLRSKQPLLDCLKAIQDLRPSTIRRQVLIGSVTAESLRTLLQTLSQNERDEALMRALNSVLPIGHLVRGRLGPDRFTLTTEDASAGKAIVGLPGGFEHGVTVAILTSLGADQNNG